MKSILILNGHSNDQSFNFALANAYFEGAKSAGAKVDQLNIRDLNFNPDLAKGYSARMELEPDLFMAWEKIQQADHLVILFPMWWGFMPARMKGLFDRLFLPGMAFQYRENSHMWNKLLKGKTAHIICTMDYPVWYYKLFMGEAGIKTIRKMILGFCGIRTTQTTYVTPIRNSSPAFRQKQLDRIEKIGMKLMY